MKSKLLKFTICQIFVLIGLVSCIADGQQKNVTASVQNVTLYDRSLQKVLSRRKRFLVWRPGSNVLLTGSLVKPLVFPRPTGHNLIVELDIFYPLPDTWRKPVKKPPPPPPPPPEHHHHHEEIIESWQGHDNHPGEIWMPPAGWNDPSNVIPNINDLKGGKRRNWSPQDSQENSNNWNEGNLFNYRPAPVTQYENPFIKRQYQQTPKQQTYNSNNRQYYPQQGPIYSPNNYQSQRKYSMGKGRSLELLPENATTSTIQTTKHDEIDEHWEHHYHHRDRRDLYSLIEKATLGNSIDIKSCLLRTICEVQHFLMPPGYSLLQDVMRVVFTIPFKSDMNDDYSNAMRSNNQDCDGVYGTNCPMSVLSFLLHSKNY